MGDLSYQVRKDDKTIEQIREKESFYGLTPVNPRDFSSKYIDFSDEVLLNNRIIKNFAYPSGKPSIRNIKKSGSIWKELGIELQDVQYIKRNHQDVKFKGWFDKEFCKALNIGSPLKIHIGTIDDCLETQVEITYITRLDKRYILFKRVLLPKIDDKVNSAIYAHELTHAELYDAGSGIKEYVHKEAIPIFIEQLFADKISPETLEICRNNRFATVAAGIEEMKTNKRMSFKTRIDLETYLISTLEAFNLANIYFNSSDKVKREIISYINQLFTGEAYTEDILEQFDSQFESIEPSLKNLQKIKTLR